MGVRPTLTVAAPFLPPIPDNFGAGHCPVPCCYWSGRRTVGILLSKEGLSAPKAQTGGLFKVPRSGSLQMLAKRSILIGTFVFEQFLMFRPIGLTLRAAPALAA